MRLNKEYILIYSDGYILETDNIEEATSRLDSDKWIVVALSEYNSWYKIVYYENNADFYRPFQQQQQAVGLEDGDLGRRDRERL